MWHALTVGALAVLLVSVTACGSDDETPAGSGGAGTGGSADAGTGGNADAGTGGSADAGTGGSGGSSGGGVAGPGGSAGAEVATAGGTGGSVGGDGCGQAPPAEVPATVDVGGTARTFVMDVPTNYDQNTPTPIVFGFHGMTTSGEMFQSQWYGNLGSTLGDDYLLVYPDALGDPTAWDTQGTGDVEMFDALLAYLSSVYCVDSSRVFATGHSSGGFFSNHLACQRGDVLRAIAPVSGGGPSFGWPVECTGQVAAWIAHANNDDTVDFSMGQGSRDHWAAANNCDTSQTTVPSADYPCVEYVGCDAGFPVRWCEYDDGHNWAAFAPQGMYDFFESL